MGGDRVRAAELAAETFQALMDPCVVLEPVLGGGDRIIELRYMAVNREAERYLGMTEAQLLGRGMRELWHSDSADRAIGWAQEAIDTGKVVELDADPMTSAVSHDLRRFDVRVLAVVHGVLLTWRDVTPRYRMQAALQEAEDRYRMVAEHASDIVTVTVSGVVTWASPSIAAALGWDPMDWIGRSVHEFAHEDDVRSLRASTRRLPGWESAGARLRLRDRADAFRWFEVRGQRLGPGVDDPLVLSWRDVDEQVAAEAALAESEERYRLLAENSADAVVRTDADHRMTFVSPAVRRLLGWEPDELRGEPMSALLHPDDVAVAAARLARLEREGIGEAVRGRLRCKDGSYRWMATTGALLRDAEGRPAGGVAVWRDVEADVAAELALRDSERRFRLLAESAPDVVILVGPDLRVVYVSPAIEALLGYRPEELVGQVPFALAHPDDAAGLAAGRDTLLEQRSLTTSVRARMRHRDGSWRWVSVTAALLVDADGGSAGAIAHWRDAETEVALTAVLEHQARTDALTGLLTRREGWRRLRDSLDGGPRRDGGRVAVLFCDLDGFKRINDERGHQVGDALLAAVATQVRSAVRDTDFVVRVGGDELLVVLDGIADGQGAREVAEKVRAAVATPLAVDGEPVSVTASIGAAVARPGETVSQLVHHADSAMYRAKQLGGDRILVADDTEG